MALDDSAYCSIDDLVAEGAIEDPGEDEDLVAHAESLIMGASRLLDRLCRSWFWARTYDASTPLYLTGRGHDQIPLQAPPVSVSAVYLGEYSGTSAPTWELVSAHGYTTSSSRENPALIRIGSKWARKPVNGVRVYGVLGDVDTENENAVWPEIRRATIRLVALQPAGGDLGASYAGRDYRIAAGHIQSESTNGRSVTFAHGRSSGASWTGDPIVDAIVNQYRRTFA